MIVAGFGFRASATTQSLRSALALTGADQLTAIAAPADKVDAACLTALARFLCIPILPVPPDILGTIATPTNSARVRAERNTGSVAEASALAAIGPGGRLLTTRRVSKDGMATCAIATREDT